MSDRTANIYLKTVWLGVVFIVLSGTLFLTVNNVPVEVTPEDEVALSSILSGHNLETKHNFETKNADEKNFEKQIKDIRTVQLLVLDTAPIHKPLPKGQEREPSDLLRAKYGYCYDRSRTIEKTLRFLGYDVRHVSIYEMQEGSTLKTLVTPMIPSHAVSEVKTARGWLVIDSNAPWLSLDKDGMPYSAKKISDKVARGDEIKWADTENLNKIYEKPNLVLYGLYSRHGQLYPPYAPFPDIHWPAFLDNFL